MKEDYEAPRFRKNCGTEMFHPERFKGSNKIKKKVKTGIKLKNWFKQ